MSLATSIMTFFLFPWYKRLCYLKRLSDRVKICFRYCVPGLCGGKAKAKDLNEATAGPQCLPARRMLGDQEEYPLRWKTVVALGHHSNITSDMPRVGARGG
jgi:hypothetical protein